LGIAGLSERAGEVAKDFDAVRITLRRLLEGGRCVREFSALTSARPTPIAACLLSE